MINIITLNPRFLLIRIYFNIFFDKLFIKKLDLVILVFALLFSLQSFSGTLNIDSITVIIIPKSGNCTKCYLESRQFIENILTHNSEQKFTIVIPNYQKSFFERNYISKISLNEDQYTFMENDSMYNLFSTYATDVFIIKENDSIVYLTDKLVSTSIIIYKDLLHIASKNNNYDYFIKSRYIGIITSEDYHFFYNRHDNRIFKYDVKKDSIILLFNLISIYEKELTSFYDSDSLAKQDIARDLGKYISLVELNNAKVFNGRLYATVAFCQSDQPNDSMINIKRFEKLLILDSNLNIISSTFIKREVNPSFSPTLDFAVNISESKFIFNATDSEYDSEIPVVYEKVGDSMFFKEKLINHELAKYSTKIPKMYRVYNFSVENNIFQINPVWIPVFMISNEKLIKPVYSTSFNNKILKYFNDTAKIDIYSHFSSNIKSGLSLHRKGRDYVLFDYNEKKDLRKFNLGKITNCFLIDNCVYIFCLQNHNYKVIKMSKIN